MLLTTYRLPLYPSPRTFQQQLSLGKVSSAPYGLTNVGGLTYTQTDLMTGSFRFNTNPATFGLSLPQSEVTLFGSRSNKLFGTNNATGVIDFTTLKGSATNIFTIAGGEGLF